MADWTKAKLLELLDTLSKHKTRELFMYPVTEEEAPEYSSIISHPMDYTTLRALVDSGEVSTIQDFARNVDLIISNCKTYNAPQADAAAAESASASAGAGAGAADGHPASSKKKASSKKVSVRAFHFVLSPITKRYRFVH